MTQIRGWAARGAKQPLELEAFEVGELGAEEVEVAVDYCGVCHSDLSVLNNEWGFSAYPVVPGHEAVGRVTAVGSHAKGLKVGQRVGVGWTADSCMHCRACLSGDQHLCRSAVPTIVGHHGGFAERVRAHWAWAIPLPDGLDPAAAGPLLCGGITVFSPLLLHGIRPTDRVGIVGIGGLGHMGIKFANAWGCEVVAFTSSESKQEEARSLGAHRVVSSKDKASIGSAAGSLDLLIVTVNAPLNWSALLQTLKPKGRMHVVGAVLEPMAIPAFSLIGAQKSVAGSPTGSPTAIATMLDFAARHQVLPAVEHFPMSRVNDALAHLEAGKARYRIVLDADFASAR
ncbi:MAG: NAD(P)-dependent alcohol dehydrogenase [Burkholderiales bacterium]|nr:NAD(P)-dependent alcohol dehydrogenase [Burkholderiales bacterium]